MVKKDKVKSVLTDLGHVAVLFVLLVSLLVVITWTGVIRCSLIPGWCGVYYSITGPPKVAIVSGYDGLGDPDALHRLMEERRELTYITVHPERLTIDRVSAGTLEKYDLVIVLKAKTMSTDKLQVFIDYVEKRGGKLVWTGDAGTATQEKDAFVYEDELVVGAEHKLLNPWVRKVRDAGGAGNVLRFDNFIGATYAGNFCEVKGCEGDLPWIGPLKPDTEHPLTKALKPNLALYGDIALVKNNPAKAKTTIVMTVDYGTNIVTEEGLTLDKELPVIIMTDPSGVARGGRIFYYALPPDYFVREELKPEERYYSLISNMAKGILQ